MEIRSIQHLPDTNDKSHPVVVNEAGLLEIRSEQQHPSSENKAPQPTMSKPKEGNLIPKGVIG